MMAAAAILAGATGAQGADGLPSTALLTWRNEGVAHRVEPGEGLRPPTLHLAPGHRALDQGALAQVVDEIARAIEPRPDFLVVRTHDGGLLGRWRGGPGFEQLDP